MSRNTINVQYPTLDHSESVANICIEKTTVNSDGITIADAFSNKNNSMFIIIENEGIDSLLTIKAGEAYPNAMLGNIVIELKTGISAIQLQDLSRFEKADGSIDLDFEEGFNGKIYSIAKWAGVRTVNA